MKSFEQQISLMKDFRPLLHLMHLKEENIPIDILNVSGPSDDNLASCDLCNFTPASMSSVA